MPQGSSIQRKCGIIDKEVLASLSVHAAFKFSIPVAIDFGIRVLWLGESPGLMTHYREGQVLGEGDQPRPLL